MDIDATDRDRTCFLCAEIPHNAVRLDCWRRQDGNKFPIPACRTFVCAYPNTKGRKNCVTQFLSNTGAKDYYSFVRWNDSLRTLEYLDEREPESSNWIVGKCPICQGHIRGVEVIDNVRQYYNAQVRECYYNGCKFEGNFIAMQHHVIEYHHDPPLEEEEWVIPQ